MPPLADDSAPHWRARAYPIPWRIVGGALVVVSRASLLFIAVGVLTTQGPVPLAVLVRALLVCAVVPAVAGRLIAIAFEAEVGIQDPLRPGHDARTTTSGAGPLIVVCARGLRMEIPRSAVAEIVPWRVPLPGPGFALRMRSGRRFSYGLQAADPTPMLLALANDAGIDAARIATHHPLLVWAHARSAARWYWYHLLLKFVAFALVPTAVWFHAHQHIAYGGLLGQYYLEGFVPYLKTFIISWSLAAIYLLLYASVWRGIAEGVALLGAWAMPAYAAAARRGAELMCRVVYYLGVPVIVVMPFLT